MATTPVTLYRTDDKSRDGQKQLIMWCEATGALPTGEYVCFDLILTMNDGTKVYKPILDGDGELVKIEDKDTFVVLDYNFQDLRANYVGTAVPAGLEVHMS